MKNYSNQILSIVLTFLITLLLNFGIEVAFKTNGSIQVSTIQSELKVNVFLIQIENYSDKGINGLQILVPSALAIETISTSTPIRIEASAAQISTSEYKLLTLSLVPPKKVTSVLFPMEGSEECCSIVNSEELKLSVREENEVLSPVMHALYNGIQTALIYTVFFTALLLWQKARNDELDARLKMVTDKYDKYAENAEEKIEEVKKKAYEFEARQGRNKAILIRRIADYSKELGFWRDTIRKLLYQNHSKSTDLEEFFSAVTQQLGTFGTRAKHSEEYETIEALAQDLNEYEEKSKD